MGFSQWFAQPLEDFIKYLRTPQESEGDIIREYQTASGITIVEHKHKTPNTTYRPRNFQEYIGQEKAKNILQSYISATKEREAVLPHILIHGHAGCGKTTLANIIANETVKPFKEIITSTLKSPYELIMHINFVDGGILFLDEIHSIDRSTAEGIYTLMEDFKYNGVEVKPFTLIGATTELGEMLKDRQPFVDRFKVIIELEDYTITELMTMTRQYRNLVFPHENNLAEDTFINIACNSRGTPRTAIRLIEATIYLNGNLKQVLNNFSIIKDGYTQKDLKILKYITLNEKGIGLQGLTSYLGTSAENYIYNIEPYLLKNELILRTSRGRKITEKGKLKIEELEKEVVK